MSRCLLYKPGKVEGMKKVLLVLTMLMVCCARENAPKDGVIRVNGTWIKKDNIQRITEMYRQQMLQAYPEKALQESSSDISKNIAKQLIANEIVLQEAKKRKIGYSMEKYNATIAGIMQQFKDTATLNAELAKLGQTQEDMKTQIREGLMVDSLVKSLVKITDTVSLADCQKYYDENKLKFASEKKYRASQILFLVKKDATPAQKKEAADKAAKVLTDVKAGKDFATLAKKNSQDPTSAAAGGDIGWFKRGDFMKEIDMAIAPLAKDQVSEVFESPIGFHIVKKTGEEELPPATFDKVKDQIRSMLMLKKQNDIVKAFVDGLMAKANIFYADTSYKMAEMPKK
jgi:parvulin-like peptidyl-prolyl isomerase